MANRVDIEIPFQEFSQRYRLIRRIKDPFDRDYNIVKDMRTQRRAIVKAYAVDSAEQQQAILTNLSNYVELKEVDGLAKFINYARVQAKEIQAAFEFDDVTLEEFSKTKQLESEKSYEIYSTLLHEMLELIGVMQEIGMDIEDLRKTNILVENKDGKYAFKLFYDERERQQVKNPSGLYLSPERLIEMQRGQDNMYEPEPKIVFELGLLILTLATDEINESNYTNTFDINDVVIKKRIASFVQKFPNKYLSTVIPQMLKPYEQRPTISQIRTQSQRQIMKQSQGPQGKSNSSQANSNSSNKNGSATLLQQKTPAFTRSTAELPREQINLTDSNSTKKTGMTASIAPHPQVIQSLAKMKEKLARLRVEARNYQDGSVYQGQMRGNVREGTGIYSYSHGDVYFGEWKDNALINGTYMFKNGQSYQGSVRNGKHGFGKYRYANGNVYEGAWENDLKHGKGQMKYPNGDRYDGNWVKGKKNGYGIYYYNNGIVYEGNYVDGKKSGFGSIIFHDSTRFQGTWHESCAQGFGKILYQNGDVFEGEFKESVKNGNGCYKWRDRSIYKGDLKQDTLSGRCRLQYQNGDAYDGFMVNGLKDGQGTYTYANKDVFVGAWKQDKKHMGRYIYSDGCLFEGQFRDNLMFFGTMTYPTGDVYQGEFRNNVRHGFGKYLFADGTAYSGEWINDAYVRQDN